MPLRSWRLTSLVQAGTMQDETLVGNAVAEKRIDFNYDAAGRFEQIARYADRDAVQHVASTYYSYDTKGRPNQLLPDPNASYESDYERNRTSRAC